MMINDVIIDKYEHFKSFYAEKKSDNRDKTEIQFGRAYCYMHNCTHISMLQ